MSKLKLCNFKMILFKFYVIVNEEKQIFMAFSKSNASCTLL